MSIWFEKLFEEVDTGLIGSSYGAALKSRKWLLVLLFLIYLMTTGQFVIRAIDIPYIQVTLPTRDNLLLYLRLAAYYLFFIFALNVVSLLSFEYFLLIQKKKVEFKIDEIKSYVDSLMEGWKREFILEIGSRRFEGGPNDPALRVHDALERISSRLQYGVFSQFNFGAAITISILPQVFADLIRFGSVFVFFIYVMYLA